MPSEQASRLNQQNLRVYHSAAEQGILESIVIDPAPDACEAVRAYRDKYDQWSIPQLPVQGCDIPETCSCTFRANFHDDIDIRKR